MKILLATAAAAMAFVSTPASAAVIDFENLGATPNGPSLEFERLDFTGISFTSPSNRITTITSGDNNTRICANAIGCIADLNISFSEVASNFSFDLAGANTAGISIGEIFFTFGDGSSSSFDLISDTIGAAYSFQDFTSLTNISSIRIVADVRADSNGYSFDNFSFSSAAVPEPATWLSMIVGFGLLGGALRRRPRAARLTA